MDIFYYSNLCPHSQKVIQFIVKQQLQDRLSCICVDKRKYDANKNNMVVVLESGKQVMLPPNLQSIPAILCVKRNYTLVMGTEPIIEYLQTAFNMASAQLFENPYTSVVNRRPQAVEPQGVGLGSLYGNSGIYSESFTSYHMRPDDLAAQSESRNRPMHGFTRVDQQIVIETPEDKWRPDKVASNVTIDTLQQERNREIPVVQTQPPPDLYGNNPR